MVYYNRKRVNENEGKVKSFLKKLRRIIYLIKGYTRDEIGYWRTKEGFLVHRIRAYNKIYSKERDKYPFPYSLYVIHHKDGDKENNKIKNLIILTVPEHNLTHNYNKENIENLINLTNKTRSLFSNNSYWTNPSLESDHTWI